MPEITLNKLYVWTWSGVNLKFVPVRRTPDRNVYVGLLFRNPSPLYNEHARMDLGAHIHARELIDAVDFVATS